MGTQLSGWQHRHHQGVIPKLSAHSQLSLHSAFLGHIPSEGEKVLGSSPEAKPTILPYPPNRMITRKFFELKEVFSSGLNIVKNLLLS